MIISAACIAAVMLVVSTAASSFVNHLPVATAQTTTPTIVMQDTTLSGGLSLYSARQVHAEYVSPSSALVGEQIDSIVLTLRRAGSPTGTAEIGIINTDRSIKQVFGTLSVSTLTTGFASYEFRLPAGSTPYTVVAGDRIGIRYSAGNSNNFVLVAVDQNAANPFDGSSTYRTFYTTAWRNFPSYDLTMTLMLYNNNGGPGEGEFVDSMFENGLDRPTSMAFAPDGRIFVTEQGGAVRVIKNGQLLSAPFLTVPVDSTDERGLLGLVFDPNFSANRYVYVYYTTSSDPIHNRVSRFTASATNPDVVQAGSERVLLNLDNLQATFHNGGAIHFGSDGRLYIAAGENGRASLAQSLSSLLGKMLRINPDGSVPTDNPFYNTTGARREIWALGLRNPFTFAFRPGTNTMYINDVGRTAWEEINLGARGANYGWPTCEGACASPSFTNPIYAYPHPSQQSRSIAGGAFYQATQFPSEYRGGYFFGDFVGDYIQRLTPANQAAGFLTNTSSPVDIDVGPDGSLYYLSYLEGSVHKVQYIT